MSDLPRSASIVVIGGGAIGLSIAYHLGCLGVADVVLLERNQLTSGTSWHAAGIVGPLRANMNLTRLAIYATELFPELEPKPGRRPATNEPVACGWRAIANASPRSPASPPWARSTASG